MGITARRGMIWFDQLMKFKDSQSPAHGINSIGAGNAILACIAMAQLRSIAEPLSLYMKTAGIVCAALDGMPELPEDLIVAFSTQ